MRKLSIFSTLLILALLFGSFGVNTAEAKSTSKSCKKYKSEYETKYDALYNYTAHTQEMMDAVYNAPGQSDYFAGRQALSIAKKRKADYPAFKKTTEKKLKSLTSKIKKACN